MAEPLGEDLEELLQAAQKTYSYLQRRGLWAFTLRYRLISYRTMLRQRGRFLPMPWPQLRKRLLPQLSKSLAAGLIHLPVAVVQTLLQAVVRTMLETVRTAPPMLAVVILLFFTSDTWKIFGREQADRVWGILVIVLVCSVGLFFVGSRRTRRAEGEAGTQRDGLVPEPAQVSRLAQRVKPVRPIVASGLDYDASPLAPSEHKNLLLLYWVLIVGDFLAVGIVIAAALMLFGALAFDESKQMLLLDAKPHELHVLIRFSIAHTSFAFTWQLALVSLMLSSVAVLYYAAAGLQDADARAALVEPNIQDLASCVSAFYYYRAVVGQHLGAATVTGETFDDEDPSNPHESGPGRT